MPIGHSFIELASVDSTNNYAMARAHAGTASHGTLFFAYDQWAGKGQRGKSWTSQPGDNIVLSALLTPGPLPITQQFSLSAAVALACHDFFSRYAGTEDTRIKWPNDLYWRDRKAGGILIENSFKGDQWAFAIVGMGININQVQFPDTARNPVSLRQISGGSYKAVELARELGQCLDHRYAQLLMEQPGGISGRAADAGSLIREYNDRLYRRGEPVRLKKDNAVFTTTVQGVLASGKLVTRDTLEREFGFGEVEWII